jgi:hypothetical protein
MPSSLKLAHGLDPTQNARAFSARRELVAVIGKVQTP